ncbi:MAG: HIT domain-containing protein [Planctomycetota bacterium]
MEYILQRKPNGCVFCEVAEVGSEHDDKNYVVWRGEHNYVVLNLWPYNNGHVMIVPYRHIVDITEMTDDEALETMKLSQKIVTAYRDGMSAQGVNVGYNLGTASGGSIGHLHLHLVPRWVGDSNFMPVIGQTKVLVEMLDDTLERLREAAKDW